jgi:hypothetical protein
MADITLLGREYSGRSVIVIFRFHGTREPKRMLARDMLRSPLIVAALSDIDLATVGKFLASEFGG